MVDSLFYHKINRVFGKDTVNITIYYNHLTDGAWNGIANWNLNSAHKWGSLAPTSLLFSPMDGVKKTNWSNWSNLPYALIARVPDPVQIFGPNEVCVNTGPSTYTNSGDINDQYVWNVQGGYIIGSNSGSSVQIVWDSVGVGTVSAQEISPWGYCIGMLSNYFVTVYPNATADFQVVPKDSTYIFAFDLIHFLDQSQNAVQWNWDFGDGITSTQQDPYHEYEKPGIYTVCLAITNIHGCQGDTCKNVEVTEGLIIPNVFTPNGDGFNDIFNVEASGMTDFHLQIFNRWGSLLFESTSPAVQWDGRTLSGTEATDGTYFYVLVARSNKKDYSSHGCLTLLRH